MTPGTPDPAEAVARRSISIIAIAAGSGSLAINVWLPFLPLFMLQLGAKDEADALFWVALGWSAQGTGRLISGPIWGLLSDRFGRKKMLVRALFGASLTCFVLSLIQVPWQVGVALGLQGLLSGYVPAAIALTSVTVPDVGLKSALTRVSGGQFIGNALGPGCGALLALAFGFRGAIAAAGVLMVIVATAVMAAVPADLTHKVQRNPSSTEIPAEPFKPTLQFMLAVLLYFAFFSLNTFRVVATPIALKQIASTNVTEIAGIAFTLGGIASALGVWLPEGRLLKKWRLRTILVSLALLGAVAHVLLALSDAAWVYIVGFTAASFLNAAMVPATNSLIAFNVSRTRRGTAFGIASSAQAVAFMIGPTAAAMFATTSLKLGFGAVSVLLVALAVLIALAVREPTGAQ
jgi:DHA1 family multidrug resistance protein-like MFS transporter